MENAQLILSRKNLLHNYNYFKSKLPSSTKMAILVKANGYGLGDIEVASLAQEFGANYLAVAFPNEGVRLKKAGIELPVIILTPGVGNFDTIVEYNLETSIVNESALEAMTQAVIKAGKSNYPIHIKLDSGMQRVGFGKKEIEHLGLLLKKNNHLTVKSIFSHLAAADDPKHDQFTMGQIDHFQEMAQSLKQHLNNQPMMHILNSPGIERFSHAAMDMVRLGIGLYGGSAIDNNLLKPAASLCATVIDVKEVGSGSVGYGRHGVVTDSVTKVATVAAGYADGVNRLLSRGNHSCLVKGALAPIFGNISMDTFVIDVSGIDVEVGDLVTIFGESLNPADIAKKLNTITYEVLTSVSSRVSRIIER